MKQLTIYFIVFILYCNNSFGATINFTQEEQEFIKTHPTISFSDVTWEPFSKVEAESYKGIFKEYYKLIEQKTGLKFEFKKVGDGINFEKVLNALKDKKIDMIDGSGKTSDREKYAIFTDPFMQVNLVVASNSQNPIYNLKQNASKLTMAVAKGSTAYEYIKEKDYVFKELIITNGVEEALHLVNLKKVDGMIENIVVVDYLKREKNFLNVELSILNDYEFKIYSIVRNDYPTLVSILNKAIDNISKEEILKINSLLIQRTMEIKHSSIELSDEQKEYLKNKKEITMCVDPDWEPFEVINKEEKHEGIAADIIALVAERLNIHIKLVPTKTWNETLRFSQYKMCDILSFINESPERKKWLVFTEPIFSDPNVLIARTDYPLIEDLSTLNATMAFPRGTAMFERFSKDFPNLIFVPVDTEAEAFDLIESRKVDLTLRSLIVTAHTIKKEGIFNLKIVGKPEQYVNYLRMGVLKEEAILRDILNVGIATLSKEDIDKIVNHHVAVVVEEKNYFTIGFWVFVGLFFVTGLILLWNYLLRKKIALAIEKNTEQSKLLFEQTKQAELGRLIANISHQWRDGITKIGYINLTTMAKLKMNQDISKEYLEKSTHDIEQTLDFMSQTMQNFLEYYKPSNNKIEFDVIESIHASMSILNTKIKNHDVTITIIGKNMNVFGIKNKWMQIWLNLINNSINQAVRKELKSSTILICINENSISFEDNCEGFDEHIIKNFQSEHFSGLGLKMSKDIANQEGWDIEILNTKEGAVVKVFKIENTKQKSN